MKITEDQIIEQFQKWLTECDRDELARVTGELFGGNCFPVYNEDSDKWEYDFEPDENYYGAFLFDQY